MIKIHLCACAIAIVWTTAPAVSAQSWDAVRALKPGERVEVQESGGQEHSGALRAVSAESISLAAGKNEVSIERAKVRTVRVRATARRVRGLLIGAGIGLALAIAVDLTVGAHARNEGGQNDGARALTYIAPIGGLAALGAVMPGYKTVYRAR